MNRVIAGISILVLLIPFVLPASVAAGDRKGPSSKEVKQMIKFGISLGKEGLWKEALYRWQEALRYDPDNPKLLNNIAVALESQGDLEGAREAYQRALELDDSARYIERNIADFEELFTALEQYEAEYRKPPAAEGEDQEPTEPAGEGEAVVEASSDGEQAPVEEIESAGDEGPADPAEAEASETDPPVEEGS